MIMIHKDNHHERGRMNYSFELSKMIEPSKLQSDDQRFSTLYIGHQPTTIKAEKLFYYSLNIILRINFAEQQWNESRTISPYKIRQRNADINTRTSLQVNRIDL